MPKVFGYVELNEKGMEKSRITSPGPFPIIDYDPAFGVEILDNKITSHWIMNGHYTELDKGTVIIGGQTGHVHDVQAYINQAEEMKDIQGQDGNWNYDGYMCGMYNGMELILATIQNRYPMFRTLKKGAGK